MLPSPSSYLSIAGGRDPSAPQARFRVPGASARALDGYTRSNMMVIALSQGALLLNWDARRVESVVPRLALPR
jgi:hypothetical protein